MIKRIRRIIRNYRNLRGIVEENSQEIANLKAIVEEKNNQINNLETQINTGLGGVTRTFESFEYKSWQDKMLTNKIFYYENLRSKLKDYKKDFNPLVSIVIPVYNGANYLKCAIDSALNQTYKNIEIIVVNDGSTDNGETEKVAKSYGNKIRYIHKENGGVSSALNTGIKNMKGNYFAWLSHDDTYYSNHIEENINFLRYHSDDKIIPYSCFDFIDKDGKINMPMTIMAGIHIYNYKLTLYTNYSCVLRGEVNGGNVLIPREAFEECGYFQEGNKITQEKDMWARLIKKYKFINVPIITYSIRTHEKQVSNTAKNVIEETVKKVIEIVDNITEEEMIRESGSTAKFYFDLYVHYNNIGINELADEFYKRYKELTK